MASSLVRVSKFLSLVLRHDPARTGIVLDPAGWADVEALLSAAQRSGISLDRATLERVVAENDKQRFALTPDGARIRANQGHSVPVNLGLAPQVPPVVLYHGTAARHVESIRRQGLQPGKRIHVHLSSDQATARTVGRRHGSPVVLQIAAGRMHDAGFQFLRSENGVWLTDQVPVQYITIP